MYNRLKSSLLNHFQKGNNGTNGMSKEDKKRLRHSVAECHLNDTYLSSDDDSAHLFGGGLLVHQHHSKPPPIGSHAPLAPQEEYLDESSTSTFFSDTIATSFSSNGDYEDNHNPRIITDNKNHTIMTSPSLSWSVQYVGSFPISSVDNLARRIDNFQATGQVQNVEFAVSILGVRICCEKTVIMSHSLRRITDVASRPDSDCFGYVATEPVGRTYRRLCHVYRCRNRKEAEDVENVLKQATTAGTLPTSARLIATSHHHKPTTVTMNPTSSMTEKRSASTVFLNRFLGKKGSQTIDETGQCKRKRRPVSAVFSSAIHRLSSSTSAVNPKRMTTIEPTTTKEQIPARCTVGTSTTTTSTSSVASSSSSSSNGTSSSTSPVPPQTPLVYDEKLGEWIYPIDATITAQLDNCSYFVGMPTRDSLVYNLLSQPEGAFVIRYSESKSKCLALSMRVPVSHNPGGISHYLIIRNEHGFRLKLSATKKPFPTLQMMLTHHSVLEGHLPCTLHFVQWQKTNFKQQLPPAPTAQRHSTALTKIDENRNVTSSGFRTAGRCADDFSTTPKNRRSRHEMNAMRRSHFFDDRHIVL